MKAVFLDRDGVVFNISTGVATTDLEVFQLVRDLLGKQVAPNYVARRPGEIDNICLDISKAKSLLQWGPCVGLSEGASNTVSYFQRIAAQEDVYPVRAGS
jgi:nucleoside-diphosphate-sugar epimerase